MGVGDHARPDLSGAIVRGRDHDRHLQRRLDNLHLPRPRVRMAEDALVRRDRDAADSLYARDGPAHNVHPEDLSDERDRFVVVARMDDRSVVVAEDVVADRAEPMRERVDRVADRVELRLLDERGCEDAFRIQRQSEPTTVECPTLVTMGEVSSAPTMCRVADLGTSGATISSSSFAAQKTPM